MDFEIPEYLKDKLLYIVRRAWRGETYLLDESEKIILFHWVRNMHHPAYDFIPKKYRRPKDARK